MMNLLSKYHKRFYFFTILIFSLCIFNSCGIYKPTGGKVPARAQDRVKKNLEEGKGLTLFGGNKAGGTFQFASANPMWRATLEILDFLPLANVDYSGGIVATEWYNEGTSADESIKITVRFLSNEVRSDALKIIVHRKKCGTDRSCSVKKISSILENELRLEILKKAVTLAAGYKKTVKERSFERPDNND
jgi:hypothetical protein